MTVGRENWETLSKRADVCALQHPKEHEKTQSEMKGDCHDFIENARIAGKFYGTREKSKPE